MADQIFADGPVAAPAIYEVPGSAEIIPLAVQAELDGSGASGDFVPTLIFRSQAGHVIARVPTETTVAAGGSAEVSWFPGVKRGGGSSAAAGAEWFLGTHITSFSCGGLDAKYIPWTATETSNSTLFTLTATHGADTTIRVATPGITLMSVAASTPEVVNFQAAVICSSTDDRQLGSYGNNYLTDIGNLATPAGQSDVMRDYRISVGTVTPMELFCRFFNFDGVTRKINNVTVGVVWWPNSTLAT